ncbi:hypothetical protein ACQ10S_14970, partial [Enterococcus faecalis]
ERHGYDSTYFNIMSPSSSFYSDEKSRALVNKTKSAKVRPWREKKIDNVDYSDILEILKIKKAYNVKQCGNVLEFKPSNDGYL